MPGKTLTPAEVAKSNLDDEKAGRDFWLTRNGHGTGFWDEGLGGKLGDALTKKAEAYGSYDLYVGDDGLIHGRCFHCWNFRNAISHNRHSLRKSAWRSETNVRIKTFCGCSKVTWASTG